MPSKITSKSTAKKASEADDKTKAAKKPAAPKAGKPEKAEEPKADKPARAPFKEGNVKSLLPKITARTAPVKKEEPAAEAEPTPAPEPAKAKAATVSLIDDKPKKVRKAATEAEKKSLFTPISKVLEAEQAKAAPAPAPAAPTVPEGAEVIEEDGKKIIHVKPPIIVRDLAAAMSLKPFQVIGDLMAMNIFVNLTQSIESEIAVKICEKHGFIFEKEKREKGAGVHKVEPQVELPVPTPTKPAEVKKAEEQKEQKVEFKSLAPIVT